MVKALADEIAIAFRNKSIRETTNEISKIVSSTPGNTLMKNIFYFLDEKVKNHNINLSLFLWNEEIQSLKCEETNSQNIGQDFAIPKEVMDYGKSIVVKSYKEEEPIDSGNIRKEHGDYFQNYNQYTDDLIISELDIPLRFENNVIGVLNAELAIENGFNSDIKDLLTLSARLLGAAIGLTSKAKKSNKDFEKVLDIVSHHYQSHIANLSEMTNDLLSISDLPIQTVYFLEEENNSKNSSAPGQTYNKKRANNDSAIKVERYNNESEKDSIDIKKTLNIIRKEALWILCVLRNIGAWKRFVKPEPIKNEDIGNDKFIKKLLDNKILIPLDEKHVSFEPSIKKADIENKIGSLGERFQKKLQCVKDVWEKSYSFSSEPVILHKEIGLIVSLFDDFDKEPNSEIGVSA